MQAYESVGCCGASSKGACTRPPCPCNLEEYSKREIRQLEDEKRAARRKAVPDKPPKYDSGV